ncbi:MAG: spore cortex biosynthesis protein YabQ [Clostridia bacterium]|jgi:spore cortex biosynthesis protein YabQ|nr:spore cortex biosynthesis protein YabQ [Clostridia bacterium]MDD4572148.1 spore cortex biosynthesis protein YabQ [Clostridia bacterium]
MSRATLQIVQFLASMGIGFALAVLYDFYRVWLKKGRSRLATALGDAVFTCLALGSTFVVLLWLNKAEVRFYILLAIGLGLLVYLKWCSPYLLPFWQRFFSAIGSMLRFLFKITTTVLIIIFKPIILISGLFYRIFYLGFKGLHKTGQKFKKSSGFAAKKAAAGSKKLKNKVKKAAGRFKKPKNHNS